MVRITSRHKDAVAGHKTKQAVRTDAVAGHKMKPVVAAQVKQNQ